MKYDYHNAIKMQFKDVYNVCINVSLVIMPSHHRHTLVKTNKKISTVGSLTGIEHRSHRSYAWAWEQVNTGQHQIKCSEGQMESGTQRGMFFFSSLYFFENLLSFHSLFIRFLRRFVFLHSFILLGPRYTQNRKITNI